MGSSHWSEVLTGVTQEICSPFRTAISLMIPPLQTAAGGTIQHQGCR